MSFPATSLPLRPRGFSLVELLVVMGIMGILASLAIVGFSSINRGAGARGAADLAASMAMSARIEAMSMGLGSLLVVDNGTNADRRLRRMAVFRKTPDPSDSSVWILQMVGKPTEIQNGIYFLPGYSGGYTATNVNLPGAPNTPVYAFTFTPTGHLKKEGTSKDIRMVFSPGPVDQSGNPQDESTTAASRAGILLHQNGRPTYFTTPEQMKPADS